MQWYSLLSMLGAVQGVLLAILLFTRPNNRRANRCWAVFVLLLSVSLTEHFYQPNLPTYWNEVIGGAVFLHGPLVYGYVILLLGDALSKEQIGRHLALFIAYQVLLPVARLVGLPPGDWIDLLIANLFFGQFFYYGYRSFRRMKQACEDTGELANPLIVNWLHRALALLMGVYGLSFLAMYALVFGLPESRWILVGVQAGCVLVVYLLSYSALVQPNLIRVPKVAVRYQHSALSEEDKQRYLDQILNHMKTQRPYLQSTLTLDQFARELGINRMYVSQIINEQLGKNFSDFINEYRVEEAKQRLLDPAKAHYSVLGIAYEAGFNSKTVFNAAFKKATGQNPSDYRKAASQ